MPPTTIAETRGSERTSAGGSARTDESGSVRIDESGSVRNDASAARARTASIYLLHPDNGAAFILTPLF